MLTVAAWTIIILFNALALWIGLGFYDIKLKPIVFLVLGLIIGLGGMMGLAGSLIAFGLVTFLVARINDESLGRVAMAVFISNLVSWFMAFGVLSFVASHT